MSGFVPIFRIKWLFEAKNDENRAKMAGSIGETRMNKKLVVITGASSGFGMAMAKEFSKDGYPLLLLARRIEKMEALNLPDTMCRKVDVSDKEAFETTVREAEAEYGKTDLLVNNAGVMLLGDIANQDPKEWKTMLDVNLS